jgi:AraC-like DNA-binding protein
MDALSDVLKSVRLEGAVYLNAEFTAPWCVEARHGIANARKRLPGADHVMFFHFFAEGGCKVPLEGGKALEVHTGDVLLFPHGDTQLMGSDLRLAPVQAEDLTPIGEGEAGFMRIRHGGGGVATRVICGYLACSRSLCRPLLEVLPRALRIPMSGPPGATLVPDLLKVAVLESAERQPGAESMLAKLSELVFVEALRRYVKDLPPKGRGWLAGVRDVQVGRALAFMHAEPAKPWTVEELARAVAMSRSALAERFASLVGEPPIQYLMRWRLALAAQALRATREPVIRVAERAGYESEAAFSRAFKREFGVPPAAWRRGRAPVAPEAPT